MSADQHALDFSSSMDGRKGLLSALDRAGSPRFPAQYIVFLKISHISVTFGLTGYHASGMVSS
jgi:hypothetical protein